MESEQARVASLNSSVYVRGFPNGSATEEALVKIFSQFGPVKKVYIDTVKVQSLLSICLCVCECVYTRVHALEHCSSVCRTHTGVFNPLIKIKQI